jgi:CSLREA domain-containing protein
MFDFGGIVALQSLVHSSDNNVNRSWQSKLLVVTAALMACLCAAPVAAQNTWAVNTTVDDAQPGTPANCQSGSASPCTLRDAIAAANADTNDTIYLSGLTGTITLIGGPLSVNSGMTIIGPEAAQLAISGANTYQMFIINSGASVSISGLTIANGIASSGGAINNNGTLMVSNCIFIGNLANGGSGIHGGSGASGGAILNNSGGSLTVIGSVFVNNSANSASHGEGGAIYNLGTSAVIYGSTFSGNSAVGTNRYAGGGALCNDSGTMTVGNSTFVGNLAYGGTGTRGGAIVNHGGASLAVTNSTLTGNSAQDGGGGIYVGNGTLQMANTVISGNWLGSALLARSYDDLDDQTGNATFSGSSGNVIGYYNAATSGTNPTQPASPAISLAPLGNYGGTTQTMLPLPGSPAICAGLAANVPLPPASSGPSTDQRGWPINPSTCPSNYVDAGAVQTNYVLVNTLLDTLNNDATSCTDGQGNSCSLRDALKQTGNGMADIGFAPALFLNGPSMVPAQATIALGAVTTPPAGTAATDTHLPWIAGTVNLMGPGANLLTISGNQDGTVGTVLTVNSSASVNLYGLTIANGNGGPSAGGILNSGALTVANSMFSQNASSNPGSAIGSPNIASGSSTVTVIDSTFSGNTNGWGAISVPQLGLINSTVVGSSGYGIEVVGPTSIVNSTIVDNSSGGIWVDGPLTLNNSIVAGNTTTGAASSNDCLNCSAQGPNNLIGLPSGVTNINQILGSLAYNPATAGVEVMIPLPDTSPFPLGIVCQGSASLLPAGVTTDERGFPMDTNCGGAIDLGAVQTNYTAFNEATYPAVIGQIVAPSPYIEVVESNDLTRTTDSVVGIPVTLSLSSSPSYLSGGTPPVFTTPVQTVNGTVNEAVFSDLVPNLPNTFPLPAQLTLTWMAGNWTGTMPLTVDTAQVTYLGFTTSPASTMAAGAAQTIVVQEETLEGGWLTSGNDSITLTVTGPNSYSQSYTTTAVNGAATFTQPVPTIAGQYSYLLADNTNPGVSLAAPVTQMVTALSNAGILTATAGTPQSAYITSVFATPLTVVVSDLYGNPISGVNVTFAAPSSGASAALSTTSCTTAILGPGLGTCSVTATANGTTGGYTVTATAGTAGTLTANFSLTNLPPPIYTVTTLIDDVNGAAVNCNDTSQGATPNSTCSLRDAIAAAAAVSTPTLTPSVNFAVTQSASSGSITLSTSAPGDYNVITGGTLNIASNMNIVGPGANLLSIDGGQAVEVFKINGGTVSISGLTITNGSTSGKGGGGIFNQGTLTIASCTISNSTANPGQGGGVLNQGGTLFVTNSTFSGNYGYSGGGGIYSWYGAQTVTDSTFSGNSGSVGGGIWPQNGALTMVNSTISGNSGPSGGAGLVTGSATTLANVVIPDAIQGSYTDNHGNVTSENISLAPLGYYGGTTQTMPPLPGSIAICAGTAANATGAGLTTDQRGNPRSTLNYSSTACVDAGAVQTAYSLAFTTSPSNPQQAGTAFTPAPTVQLSDLNPATGQPAPIALPGAPITVALSAGAFSSGPVTASTSSNGVSTFGGLVVSTSTVLPNDNLIASAQAGSYSITANSSNFDIDLLPQSITFTLPGTAMYNGVNLTDTLSATGGATGNPVTFTIDGISTPNIASINGNTLTISGPGTVVVDANQAGGSNYAAATQVQQAMLVTLDTPATIAVYSGNTQSAYVNTAFTNTLTALVTDASGNGVYGLTVTFVAPASGASATLSNLTAVTGPNGQASVSATANTTQGNYNVTASVAGVVTSASFNLTNAPPPIFVVNTTADDTTAPTQQTAQTNCPVNPTITGAGSCTLRDALAAAGNAGTGNITFDPVFSATNAAAANTITLGSVGSLMMPPYTSITGPTPTVVNGVSTPVVTVSGNNQYTIFTNDGSPFAAAPDSIANLAIENGISGIDNVFGTLTVSNSIISGNFSVKGGGIYNFFGNLTVTGSIISNNSALNSSSGQDNGKGGGIFNLLGSVVVQNSTFSGNSAEGSNNGEGGAIFTKDGRLQVSGSTFTYNSTRGDSGDAGGGAICNTDSVVSISGSTFFGNTTTGTELASGGAATISQGGAILNRESSTLTLTNSTISGNGANLYGGGIFNDTTSTIIMANTIVSGNWLGIASTPSSYDDLDDQSTNITFIGTPIDKGGNVMGYYNAFSATPLPTVPPSPTINLAPLANYGGPTQTMIPLPGSAAICAGTTTPSGGLTLPSSDQRGDPNTNMSYPGYNATTPCVDAGAVQTNYSLAFTTQPSPIAPATAILPSANFQATLTLDESGLPLGSTVIPPATSPSVNVPLTLTSNPTGAALTGGSASTVNGIANYSTLQVSAPGTDDTLTASLTLNGALTPALAIPATSTVFQVGQMTPTITWPTVSAITYGQALSTSILTGGSASYNGNNVPGTFAWTAPATVPAAGSQSEAVTFIPIDTADYNGVAGTVSVSVATATLTVTASSAVVNYGAILPTITPGYAGWQNGDTSTSLTTAPACSTTYTATSHPGSYPTSCSGAVDPNYTFSYIAGSVTVSQATATVTTLPTAPAITYGQVLSASTLSGGSASYNSNNVPGTFAWTTPTTIPVAGSESEAVTFTPTDAADYQGASASVQITVNQAPLAVTANNQSMSYDGTLPPLTGTLTGVVAGDGITALFTTTATASSPVGSYPIAASLNDPNSKLGNYTVTNTPGTLTIGVVTPALVLNCPTVTYDANAHSCTGSASGVGGAVVSGTWSISPASETAVGSYPVVGIFTSSDANYASGGTASGTLVIQQTMPGVALTSSMNPALMLNGVTLTATVSSQVSVPSGSVTFYNGATALTGPVQLSNGSATLVTNSLPIGNDSLTAVYSGDANFVTVTSNAVAEVIEDFSLSLSGSGGTTVTVAPGTTATFNLLFSPEAPATTFPAAIQLSVTGLPYGATYGFTPASITAGSGPTPATLTITPPAQASTSKHQAPFRNPEMPLALAILLIVPLSRRLRTSAQRFRRIAAPLLLMLAVGVIMAGLSGCGGNSSSSTQPQQQTYTITITGTSGALSHSTTVTLIVE